MKAPSGSTQIADKTAQNTADTVYHIESTLPLAGIGEKHTLKEWKRIYGYEPGYMFCGRFVTVDPPQPFHHENGSVSYQSPEETRELCRVRDAKKNREAASADLLAALQELLAARQNQIKQHAYLHRAIDTGREREAEAHSIRSDRRMERAESAARASIAKATGNLA